VPPAKGQRVIAMIGPARLARTQVSDPSLRGAFVHFVNVRD
jgi:hypothetical protein